MVRRYDLLAICLLMFTAILTVAMAYDPKGFSIKEWQPLMAAILALGSAAVVFRGAKLAYSAAMEKVELDRIIHQKEVRRRQRGIFLRTALAAHIMHHEADRYCKLFDQPSSEQAEETTIDPAMAILRTVAIIDDAWSNLEIFSKSVADDLLRLKVHSCSQRPRRHNWHESYA